MADATGLGDFIFGTLATTSDRVMALTEARRGLSAPTLRQNDGGAVNVTLTAGPDALVNSVMLYFSTNGSDPAPNAPGTTALAFMEYPPAWDTLLWAYVRRFEAIIPSMLVPPGALIRCRVIGQTRNGESLLAADGRRFAYPTTVHPIPHWLRNAVIYHVFMDRFATQAKKPFAGHENLNGFFGGTLRGVTEQLPYLSDLGVDALWLSPIFPSPSHHGYDSTDFREIEPRLGTKADLKLLVDAAHARGIRVLLDFVPNHVSNKHPFFMDAQTNPASSYRNYFTFTHWPDEYTTFFGVKDLPQINNEHPAARQYVIDSAVYWLREFGIDGYRLDYAYGPSHDFWADYYTAVKAAAPDSAHFGEIVETPELLRSYTGRMDGALDFHFVQAVRKTFAYDTLTVEQFDDWLHRHLAYFAGYEFVLPSFLDNHDMNRFLWAARGDVRRLKLAALVQFTLPNPPIIYYGTETGLSQKRDIRQEGRGLPEESRLPMNWDAIDADLLIFYKQLIGARREIAAALTGTRVTLIVENTTGRYAYGYYADVGARFDGELAVLTLINHASHPNTFTLDAPGTWRDLFSDAQYEADLSLMVELAPYTGTILAHPMK
ncbi:MAG: alpha-amylase family glycosyl hydrolase [Aggregatilineales bacterium]